ncbi:MAG: DUF6694 family lipoprotein [Pseudomonadota bacterium]|nr:DUF6694 family lipoprotein [Pseudomonadota bacterium]
MQKNLLKGIILSASLALAACSEPTVNASNDEDLKASIEAIQSSLEPAKREQFNEAIFTIVGSGMDLKAVMTGEVTAEDLARNMMARLDGKTADQVITEAQIIVQEREAKQKAQALQEIADLEEKRAAAEASEAELEKFQVISSRLYKRERGYTETPIIELSVVNGTGKPISRVFFEGVVASPGRSVPWIEDTFNYSIPGGLEPGESADWSLAPNRFSGWGTDVPGDAILTLKTYKIEGPGYSVPENSFSERDQERLDILKEKYPQ